MNDQHRGWKKRLLNIIKQQIFILHLFWSRHCYDCKSDYHSLISNSTMDFHWLFKNIWTLYSGLKVPASFDSSQLFQPHVKPFSTLLPTASHTDLVPIEDFAIFLLPGTLFYPSLHLTAFFLPFKFQLKCYILRELSVDESIKYLPSCDALINIIRYISVKALQCSFSLFMYLLFTLPHHPGCEFHKGKVIILTCGILRPFAQYMEFDQWLIIIWWGTSSMKDI